jgi:hypothetical protein
MGLRKDTVKGANARYVSSVRSDSNCPSVSIYELKCLNNAPTSHAAIKFSIASTKRPVGGVGSLNNDLI